MTVHPSSIYDTATVRDEKSMIRTLRFACYMGSSSDDKINPTMSDDEMVHGTRTIQCCRQNMLWSAESALPIARFFLNK